MGMVYTWLAGAVLAIVVEVIVPGLVAIWFVPSALVAMLLSFISVPVGIQIVAFLVASVVFIFLSRKFISIKGQKNKTNIDAVVGERCIVTERIDNIHGTGKVKLNGMDWTARTHDETIYEVDEIVFVDRVEGVKLIVKKQKIII